MSPEPGPVLAMEPPPEVPGIDAGTKSGLRTKVGILAALLIVISMGHYTTTLEIPFAHDIMDRGYYIPIALAAFWFGLKGSISVGLLATLLYVPHIIQWEMGGDHGDHAGYGNKYVEAALFPLFGGFVGYLLEVIRARNTALAEAYNRLRDSYEALQRSATLAAVGQMAAGLAHEIRNPLAGLQGAVEALSDQVPGDSDLGREFTDRAVDEIRRINGLVSDFVAFGKPSPVERVPSSLPEIVRAAAGLLSAQARKQGVAVEVQAPDEGPEMMLDPDKIKQALINIMLNGIQAMPDGGVLNIELECDEKAATVSIADAGPGIPEEARDSIFTPFFSTKEQGAGLGLPLAHQIADSHGGTLRLGRPEGRGAVFVLVLPVVQRGGLS